MPFAHAMSSGTGALQAILYILGITKGDEIIIPATSPIMTALPVLSVGATPVFVDCSNSDFSIDPDDLERKITKKSKVIICVPMWGYPIEIIRTKNIAKKHNLIVIEDCSQAHMTISNGKPLGTYGDFGVFSTQERKLICTGEGGFILTKNKNYSKKVECCRLFGITHNNYSNNPIIGECFGLNYKLSALNAAIGISQAAKIKKKILERTSNANIIKNGLKSISWIKEIKYSAKGKPNYYSLVMEFDPSKIKQKNLEIFLYSNNIMSDTYRYNYKPLYRYPIFKKFESKCINADKKCKSIITLPVHEGLTKKDLFRIIENYKEI